MKRVLEIDCTTMLMYSTLLKCTLKNSQDEAGHLNLEQLSNKLTPVISALLEAEMG